METLGKLFASLLDLYTIVPIASSATAISADQEPAGLWASPDYFPRTLT